MLGLKLQLLLMYQHMQQMFSHTYSSKLGSSPSAIILGAIACGGTPYRHQNIKSQSKKRNVKLHHQMKCFVLSNVGATTKKFCHDLYFICIIKHVTKQ